MDARIFEEDIITSTLDSTAEFIYSNFFKIKDPGSAITHFIGFVSAIFGTPAMLIYASSRGVGMAGLVSLSIFMLSMILLYGASTMYHTFILPWSSGKIFKKLDHMSISVLIAGSYTPICVMVLPRNTGMILLTVIWCLAIMGMLFKLFWVTCPKWVSSMIYISMGWAVAFVFPQVMKYYSGAPFVLLLTGGIAYTIGGVVYALKCPVFNNRFKHFGSHEVFHVFVMIGSLCHYMALICYM